MGSPTINGTGPQNTGSEEELDVRTLASDPSKFAQQLQNIFTADTVAKSSQKLLDAIRAGLLENIDPNQVSPITAGIFVIGLLLDPKKADHAPSTAENIFSAAGPISQETGTKINGAQQAGAGINNANGEDPKKKEEDAKRKAEQAAAVAAQVAAQRLEFFDGLADGIYEKYRNEEIKTREGILSDPNKTRAQKILDIGRHGADAPAAQEALKTLDENGATDAEKLQTIEKQETEINIAAGMPAADAREAAKVTVQILKDRGLTLSNNVMLHSDALKASTQESIKASLNLQSIMESGGFSEDTLKKMQDDHAQDMLDLDHTLEEARTYQNDVIEFKKQLEQEMNQAAQNGNFDEAADIYTQIKDIETDANKQVEIAALQIEIAQRTYEYQMDRMANLPEDPKDMTSYVVDSIRNTPPELVSASLRLQALTGDTNYDPIKTALKSTAESIENLDQRREFIKSYSDLFKMDADMVAGLSGQLTDLQKQYDDYQDLIDSGSAKRNMIAPEMNDLKQQIASTKTALSLYGDRLQNNIEKISARMNEISATLYNEDGIAQTTNPSLNRLSAIATPKDRLDHLDKRLNMMHDAMAQIPQEYWPEGYKTREQLRVESDKAFEAQEPAYTPKVTIGESLEAEYKSFATAIQDGSFISIDEIRANMKFLGYSDNEIETALTKVEDIIKESKPGFDINGDWKAQMDAPALVAIDQQPSLQISAAEKYDPSPLKTPDVKMAFTAASGELYTPPKPTVAPTYDVAQDQTLRQTTGMI